MKPNNDSPATNSIPNRELVLTRVFDAPRSLVFKAWVDPQHLGQWWGPHGFTNVVRTWEVRPGGGIHLEMHGPDGAVYPMGGTFQEVEEPKRLVMLCGALDSEGKALFEVRNTATFEDLGDKTLLKLRAQVVSETAGADMYLRGMSAGWSQSLDRLDDEVSPGRSIMEIRLLSAPRELVWRAMTEPQHVVNWWGPVGFTTTVEEMDVRAGGVWKHVMRGPDGVNYPNFCVFQEVTAPERLVFSNGGHKEGGPGVNFIATWSFYAIDEETTLLIARMVFPSAGDRDFVAKEFGAVEGAVQTVNRLTEYLPTMG